MELHGFDVTLPARHQRSRSRAACAVCVAHFRQSRLPGPHTQRWAAPLTMRLLEPCWMPWAGRRPGAAPPANAARRRRAAAMREPRLWQTAPCAMLSSIRWPLVRRSPVIRFARRHAPAARATLLTDRQTACMAANTLLQQGALTSLMLERAALRRCRPEFVGLLGCPGEPGSLCALLSCSQRFARTGMRLSGSFLCGTCAPRRTMRE
jgi:hypothetical protein